MRLMVLAVILLAGAPCAAQNVVKVGDRVEHAPMYNARGTVVQVGTGAEQGNFLVQFDGSSSAAWVRPYGQRGTLFVIDASGRRLFDVADAGQPKPADPKPPATPAVNPGQRSTAKVGDRVEYAPMYGSHGRIVEVGTGDNAGAYRVQLDSGGSASWVRPYGQRGTLFVINDKGERLFDVVDGLPLQPGPTQPPRPPVTQPPVTQPPVTQPPVTQPPVTQPPVTQPPVTQPPVTQPPATTRRARMIRGRALFADGRALPDFTVKVAGHTGGFDPFATAGASSNLLEARGANGSYEAALPSAIVNEVSAVARIQYGGRAFVMPLHPVDGKPTWPTRGGFVAQSDTGIVRDFQLRLSGLKPDYRELNPSETTSNDDDDASNGFYGMTVDLVDQFTVNAAGGSTLTVTLVPTGPLLDGSAGTRVVRRTQLTAGQSYVYLRNIPPGNYQVSVELQEPGRGASQLRVGRFGNFAQAATFNVEPNEFAGGVRRVTLNLSR